MPDPIFRFIDFLNEQTIFGDAGFWVPLLGRIRDVIVVVNFVLIAWFIFSFINAFGYRPKLHPHVQSKKKGFTLRDAVFKERWDSIMKRAGSGSADAMKLAVIEADKLADDALKQAGLKGEHMADRLSSLTHDDLKSVDRLWRAHRLRNDLVHTPGFTMSPAQSSQALDDFQAFLKEVKVLQ